MKIKDLVIFNPMYVNVGEIWEGIREIEHDKFIYDGRYYKYIVCIDVCNNYEVIDGIEIDDGYIDLKLREFEFDGVDSHYYLMMLGSGVGGFYPQNINVELDFTISGKISYKEWVVKKILE